MHLEFFTKTKDSFFDLQELLDLFPEIKSLSLTNKVKPDPNLEIAENLLQVNSKLDLSLTFCLKYQYKKNPKLTTVKFIKFCQKAVSLGVNEVLLISGNPKKVLTSGGLLQSLSTNLDQYTNLFSNAEASPFTLKQLPKIAVAYNPFLGKKAMPEERKNLELKMASGLVSKIYLQIGLQKEKLISEVGWIKQAFPQVQIQGCLLLPSQRFLQGFKFRPWHGVNLSSEYLADYNFARQTTAELLACFKELGISPLVEPTSYKPEFLKETFEFLGV